MRTYVAKVKKGRKVVTWFDYWQQHILPTEYNWRFIKVQPNDAKKMHIYLIGIRRFKKDIHLNNSFCIFAVTTGKQLAK